MIASSTIIVGIWWSSDLPRAADASHLPPHAARRADRPSSSAIRPILVLTARSAGARRQNFRVYGVRKVCGNSGREGIRARRSLGPAMRQMGLKGAVASREVRTTVQQPGRRLFRSTG